MGWSGVEWAGEGWRGLWVPAAFLGWDGEGQAACRPRAHGPWLPGREGGAQKLVSLVEEAAEHQEEASSRTAARAERAVLVRHDQCEGDVGHAEQRVLDKRRAQQVAAATARGKERVQRGQECHQWEGHPQVERQLDREEDELIEPSRDGVVSPVDSPVAAMGLFLGLHQRRESLAAPHGADHALDGAGGDEAAGIDAHRLQDRPMAGGRRE